jgi:hydroxymethylpyrimidine/phosphomethylpyrimidine kinase
MFLKTTQTALTIAGSDSGGGAGVQADIKTFGAFNVFGTTVIAGITAQNSSGVRRTFDVPPDAVAAQLSAVLSDQRPAAVKTGMLCNEAIVEVVISQLRRRRPANLVVDPVIHSTSGVALLTERGVVALRKQLLPLALLVTPNISEAEILSGIRLRQPADRIKVARAILKLGVRSVLIKGGHARGAPEDFYFDGKRTELFGGERLGDGEFHGTGCVLSAAITAGLALGKKPIEAIRDAKRFIIFAIRRAVTTGRGNPSVDPLAVVRDGGARWDLFQRVSAALDRFKTARIGDLIPEVQSNLGVGLEGAEVWDDVIAVPGRIIRLDDDAVTVAPPRFGASRHVANIVLTVMRHNPTLRAVMNIRYTPEILQACRSLRFKIGSFDRSEEPQRVKRKEGSSLEWGTDHAILRYGSVPDIIYDLGGMGKEEMVRVMAPDVETLVERVMAIHRRCR